MASAYSRDPFGHGRVARAPSPHGRGDMSIWPRRSLVSALVRVASVAIAALSLLGRHRPHGVQLIPPAHHNAVPREETLANLHVAVIFETQHDALPDVGVTVLDEHKLLGPFAENGLQGDSQGVGRSLRDKSHGGKHLREQLALRVGHFNPEMHGTLVRVHCPAHRTHYA